MEAIAELLFAMFHIVADLRPKQALALIVLIFLGLFGLYRYGCMSISEKQWNQFNEIVAVAVENNYRSTSAKADFILSDNKITKMEFSNFKVVYERDLKYKSKT